eukprot:5000770-Amphidinium_carterae.1
MVKSPLGFLRVRQLDAGISVDEEHLEDVVQPGWNTDGAAKYFDEYTGEELPKELVVKARHEEMEYLRQLGCWVYVPFSEAREVTGKPPISTRWVDADKKGGLHPDDPEMRSRLVVQET